MRPRISKLEFKKEVRPALASHGFTPIQRDKVEVAFSGSLDESGEFAGIDASELENGLEQLAKLNFSARQIKIVREELEQRLGA